MRIVPRRLRLVADRAFQYVLFDALQAIMQFAEALADTFDETQCRFHPASGELSVGPPCLDVAISQGRGVVAIEFSVVARPRDPIGQTTNRRLAEPIKR